MNTEIDQAYRAAVEGFTWPAPDPTDAGLERYQPNALNEIVEAIAKSIISTSQIRPMVTTFAKRPLSLLDVCFIVAKQSDDKKAITTTVERINGATADEKAILAHTFKKLSALFEQVNETDLKGATLLYGIHRIHDLVRAKVIPIPTEKTRLQNVEEELAKLLTLRAPYVGKPLPLDQQALLARVDQAIKNAQEEIELLRSQEAKEKLAFNK